jgi:hypothetical protein
LGTAVDRSNSIDLGALDLPRQDLGHLCQHFSKDEVWSMIRSLLPNKAPGPDGFTACFLQSTWQVIRSNVLLAFQAFWHLDSRNYHSISEALLTLLPKKEDAETLKDYRPILLIHVMGNLFSKVLANRVAPHLDSLIHHGQSAFIKGRCIHDNFKFVLSSSRLVHAHRLPRLLLKVDIARSFDSVAWPFLLEVLRHLGFHECWLHWVSVLLSSASMKILLNRSVGDRICHARGMRQGNPLSPLIFLFVMEVLHALICKANAWSLLNPIGVRVILFRTTLYADDIM